VVAVMALFLAGLYFGSRLPRLFGSKGATRTYDTPILLQQVQTLSELVTVKYVVEKVEIWEDPPSVCSPNLSQATTASCCSRHGVVKGGVDFSQLKPGDLKVQGKTIWIICPPPESPTPIWTIRKPKSSSEPLVF